MLNISKKNERIEIKSSEKIKDSSLYTFLTISMEFSEDNDKFFFYDLEKTDPIKENKIILDLINFLDDSNIKYKKDIYVKKIIERAKKHKEYTKKIGDKAKILLKPSAKKNIKVKLHKFTRNLKSFQKDSVNHLIQLPAAANFSVPGSGKTTMVYASYSNMRQEKSVNRMLIVGPNAAFLAWSEEYEKCFGKKAPIIRVTGTKTSRTKIYNRWYNFELFFLSYHALSTDTVEIIELLKKDDFLIVLDESHYIKRIEGGIWAPNALKIAPYSKRRIILTGTPVPQSLLDLWTQITFLYPDESVLGSRNKFKREVKDTNAIENVRKNLMPYYRRVKKKDLHLPPAKIIIIKVKLNKIQRKIYNAIKDGVLASQYKRGDIRYLTNIRRAILVRLMQAASNPELIEKKSEEFDIPPIGKVKGLEPVDSKIKDLIKNYSKHEDAEKIEKAVEMAKKIISKGNKVLIWSTWIRNIELLEKKLKKYNPVTIYGDIPINEEKDESDNREIRISKFKTDKQVSVMIANPGACGESISLHDVCHHAIYVDRTFNGAQYMQSLDRIHRVGLKMSDKTQYYIFLSERTIDETIHDRLNEKINRMMQILKDDFRPIDLESDLSDISDLDADKNDDFQCVIKDLKKY